MKINPFTLSFGMEPHQYISRYSQTNEITESFTSDNPPTMVYMISGVRGSGKTVMLSNITETFSSMKEWIVINVTPDSDILSSIAAKLYSREDLNKLFVSAKLDISALGIGVSIENSHKIFDIETALEQMLERIAKKGKKVLITIDEITNNEYVKVFVSTYQILIRQKLPVFLLMTGLYDNIYNLQNEKTLTFLYRAPKIMLEPLSLNSIARSYKDILNVDSETASRMSKLTKGYAFAYQVMGFLYWKNITSKNGKPDVDSLLSEYDDLLENYVYEKIWTELSPKEKDIIAVLSKNEITKVEDIRNELSLTSGNMSVYRDRLNKKGLIDTSRFGYLSLKLPRFGEVIGLWID